MRSQVSLPRAFCSMRLLGWPTQLVELDALRRLLNILAVLLYSRCLARFPVSLAGRPFTIAAIGLIEREQERVAVISLDLIHRSAVEDDLLREDPGYAGPMHRGVARWAIPMMDEELSPFRWRWCRDLERHGVKARALCPVVRGNAHFLSNDAGDFDVLEVVLVAHRDASNAGRMTADAARY